MKECSNCKNDYSSSEERCPNCGYEDGTLQRKGEMEWVWLTTVANDIEFAMVEGLLEMGNIPALKEVKGVDGYLQIILGAPVGGISVLVPGDKYEEALQLLNSKVEDENVAEEE